MINGDKFITLAKINDADELRQKTVTIVMIYDLFVKVMIFLVQLSNIDGVLGRFSHAPGNIR